MSDATGRIPRVFDGLLARRPAAVAGVLAMTVALAVPAARVRPDYSVEQAFPTFDRSRRDYERFRKDFPFEDAHAIVVVEAPDLFTPAGLHRVAALEQDLARIPGVIDTSGLTTVKDLVAEGDTIRMENVFPSPDLPADEIARRRATVTSDPLFVWNLAPPDGRATTIRVTLTAEQASSDATRTEFLRQARALLTRHQAPGQELTLDGLPVIRSEFTELIARDLGLLFPLALLVIVGVLYAIFRSLAAVGAALVTIAFAVLWTTGAMGIARVPLHVLTQITSIVVMIISISDTVHIIAHYREAVGRGVAVRQAIVDACADSAVPCLLTEVTIAGGFLGLATNDIVMIQQFGIVTAIGMILTWVANVTVLPLALSHFKPPGAARSTETAVTRGLRRFVAWIEHVLVERPRTVLVCAGVTAGVSLALGTRIGREYYTYDDLRPAGQIARNLRRVESIHGGTVPFAIYVEPRDPAARRPDAMIEPAALGLIDRITRRLESDFPGEIRNAASLSKYMRKAHRLLAGEEIARTSPLPATRALAAQELLAIDDPRALRDIVSFDRATAAIFAIMPDKGSGRSTAIIRDLRAYLAEEETRGPYRLTPTGIFGIADGVYRSLVGGLASSLGIAVLVSFGIFCLVLRSWRLGLIGLVPNVLPLLLTLGIMSALRIDLKPSTVIVFSITLVIADDDTIQYLSRFRARFLALAREGHAEPHTTAALETLRETGLPMFATTCAVSLGFLTLLFSQFLGLANLGLLIGVSLSTAVFADLFLSPLLIMKIRPRLARDQSRMLRGSQGCGRT